MIAGTHSSVGKTVWTLALMALAREKGFTVQPFKAGPDYIDPGFHHLICSPRKSRNLDLHLLSPKTVQDSFERNSGGADLSVVEGMMGLFDGKTISGKETSSAAIAKLLNLPVFLVLDGAGLATSAAAIVLGFQKFDPEINLAGVFINRVRTESHFSWLKKAIEEKTGVPCLGYLPPEEALSIPERHLGLKTALEENEIAGKIKKAVELLEPRFDWERFLVIASPLRFSTGAAISGFEIASASGALPRNDKADVISTSSEGTRRNPGISLPPNGGIEMTGDSYCRIAVAYDAAFSFYYEDNFDLLREAGAEILFFSPLVDAELPANADLLYLGGGFPEIYAARLAANHSMKQAIRNFYQGGGFIYAECGGLIYLTGAFEDSAGTLHPLVDLIPGKIKMTNRLQNFGYQEPVALKDTFLFPAGAKLRSHEFHYSVWDCPAEIQPLYRIGQRLDGFAGERLLAGYQHLHFGSDPELAKRLVENCSSKKDLRRTAVLS